MGSSLTDTITIPDRREIWAWAADHVDFGNNAAFKGKYDVNNVPWTREILRAFKDPHVREITVVMPPQESGKTKAAEICMCWRAVNVPGPMAFNPVTNVKAEQWSDTRWQQTLKACPAVAEKFSENRHDKKKRRIVFKDGTFLLIQGAEVDANRQSDSVEIQVNDEVNLWQKPWLTQMHNRLRSYQKSRKILNIGVGGDKGSEQHERFIAGNQLEWSHHCPECNGLFQYVFDHRSPKCNIRFDLNKAVQHADGRLDLTEFEKTVYVECPHCKHRLMWSEDLMVKLNRGGEYVAMNPTAEAGNISIHASSFAIGRRPWARILEPWVRLNMKGGVFANEILKEFITQELAEFWEDRPITVSKDLKTGAYTRAEAIADRPGPGKEWWIRVMAMDNQRGKNGDREHRWFVCRDLSRDGRTRLVDCGRINEWEECRERQRALGVPDWTPERPGPWVVVDRRYKPHEVDEVCSRMKWYGMMGDARDEFIHSESSDFPKGRMLFSEPRTIDVGYGTASAGRSHSVYYLWASDKVQDIFAAHRNLGPDFFGVPSDIHDFCPEYVDHINSHRQKLQVSPKTGQEEMIWSRIGDWADHMYDCECEIIVLGLMAGIFKNDKSV